MPYFQVSYAEADAVIGTIKLNTDTLFKKLYAPDQFCTDEDPSHSPLGNPSDERSTIAVSQYTIHEKDSSIITLYC